MIKVGDKIRITYMNDECSGSRYVGREGTVTKISKDPWGDERIDGTWGMALYPSAGDEYEIIEVAKNDQK